MVIGHHCQREGLSHHSNAGQEELQHAAAVEDALISHDQVLEQLGSNNGRVTKISKRKMTKEKEYGGVKLRVNFDDYHHAQISYHSDNVHDQKHEEERNLKLWIICETQEGKHCLQTQVFCSHHYDAFEKKVWEKGVFLDKEELYKISENHTMTFCDGLNKVKGVISSNFFHLQHSLYR